MSNKCNIHIRVSPDIGVSYDLAESEISCGVFLYEILFSWKNNDFKEYDTVQIRWTVPLCDILYRWTPSCCLDRSIALDRSVYEYTMISSKAPMAAFFNGKSENSYSWAVNECGRQLLFNTGIVEESGEVESVISLPLYQLIGQSSEKIIIRMDFRKIPINHAIGDIAKWWSNDCNMQETYAPYSAKSPVYSFWYSYHQNLSASKIENECRYAKQMGFDVCIVDDGWQTGDNNRGYAFCGDWNVAKSKIPDMKSHVEAVHKIGMKYILWYSVPFMGHRSQHYNEFKSMILRDDRANGAGILDPRYKKVRDFLLDIYKNAILKWDLDGFKLDFIDVWCNSKDNAPYNSDMDIPVLQDAVDVFMTEVSHTLKEINRDVLVEFRQTYIGPHMKKYGNMFRVADCPNDILKNRAGIFDLRMLMGNLAVHSDMLMWNKDELPELAALQIISVIFGSIQYSQRIGKISEQTRQMSCFWINFAKSHRDLLLNSELTAYEPQLLYTWAKAYNENECMNAVYSVDKCVKPDDKKVIYIANGSQSNRVIAELNGKYNIKIMNCFGEVVSDTDKITSDINILDVPMGGLAVLQRS